MKLEHYPAEKLKNAIFKILNKYLDLNQYKFFYVALERKAMQTN
jgi:hypothetical protein